MLSFKKKYLQIALNSTLNEAQRIISQIPLDERIIIEAGTPLIKAYGSRAISEIRFWWEQRVFGFTAKELPSWLTDTEIHGSLEITFSQIKRFSESKIKKPVALNQISFTPYIVADLKCMDRGVIEVKIAKKGGANAAVALGHAPIETLDAFIENCEAAGLDSMIDMMNFDYPLEVLRKLKKLPRVVILHRGVDEESFNPESEIPYHEIHRIKENYDIMVAVAGGDTFQDVQRAIFNDADIVVVWKSFYQSTGKTAELAQEFLKEIR